MENKGAAPRCPLCGWLEGSPPQSSEQLPPRTILDGRYLLGRALGQGGFGITYLGWDLNLNRKLAVKEYFPREACTRNRDNKTVQQLTQKHTGSYEAGLTRFLEEGQALARFQEHPGVAAVLAFFRENGTGYIVMVYIDGLTFGEFLAQRGGKVDFSTAVQALLPVMDTLSEVHRAGLLHRDVSPDNIYITRSGQVKLLDFGAARYALGQQSRSLDVVLKPGYAPEEQYRSKGNQGPWTDVYALGATLYRGITGRAPSPALDRLAQDDLQKPSALGVQIGAQSEKVLLKALEVLAGNRYQTVALFQKDVLGSIDGPVPPPPPRTPAWVWGAAALLVIGISAFVIHAWNKQPPTPPHHPAIVAFTATPSVIAQHGDLSLHWETQDSDDVRLDGVKVAASGDTIRRNVSADTIFHLTLGGAKGVQAAAAVPVKVTIAAPPRVIDKESHPIGRRPTVSVLSPKAAYPPGINFSASSNSIHPGQSVTLRWSVLDATRVSIYPGFPALPLQGSLPASPTETTHYMLVAEGPGGSNSKDVNVQVGPLVTGPLVINSFTVDPVSVHAGSLAVLQWNVTGAARVLLMPDKILVASAASLVVRPTKTTSYILVASAPDGSAKPAHVTVQVLP